MVADAQQHLSQMLPPTARGDFVAQIITPPLQEPVEASGFHSGFSGPGIPLHDFFGKNTARRTEADSLDIR